MRSRRLVGVGALVMLGGCSLAPQYTRPAPPVPPAFEEPAPAAVAVERPPAAADVPWQEFIRDARLRSVIDLALANNRDLRVAALNVEKAGALFRVQRAEQFPTVGAAATTDVSRAPAGVSGTGQAKTVDECTVSVGFTSWELDLFGRVRSLKAAALNQHLATREARAATHTAWVAATAGAYLTLAADQEELRLAASTRDAQQASLELIQRSRDAGVVSDLEVRQAQSLVAAARAEVERFTGVVELDRHALDLLAGTPVGTELVPDGFGQAGALKAVSAELSSDVLLRRPDVLVAEYQLRAANANIGAARAAFLPRISLTAGLGLISTDLSGLFVQQRQAQESLVTALAETVPPVGRAHGVAPARECGDLHADRDDDRRQPPDLCLWPHALRRLDAVVEAQATLRRAGPRVHERDRQPVPGAGSREGQPIDVSHRGTEPRDLCVGSRSSSSTGRGGGSRRTSCSPTWRLLSSTRGRRHLAARGVVMARPARRPSW